MICDPLGSVSSPAWVRQAGLWLLSMPGISARPTKYSACRTPTVEQTYRPADCTWWSLGELLGGRSAAEVTMGGGLVNPRRLWAPMAAGCLFLGLCFHPSREGQPTTSQAPVLLSDQGACSTLSQNPPPGCQQPLTASQTQHISGASCHFSILQPHSHKEGKYKVLNLLHKSKCSAGWQNKGAVVPGLPAVGALGLRQT